MEQSNHSVWLKKLVLLSASVLLIGPAAWADKPSWAGSEQGKSEQHGNKHGNKHDNKHDNKHGNKSDKQHGNDEAGRQSEQSNLDAYFTTQHIKLVRDYYQEDVRKHGCPPGLAKKNNGCMPPGQAKKWRKGQALARDVVYLDVPRSVITIIGAAPAGHRYVRVANDILLIAIGTSMVVDAIEDILR